MTADQLEQITRMLTPAIRETVRAVMEEELDPFAERVKEIEVDVAGMKKMHGRLFGVWSVFVLIMTLIGKTIYDGWISPWITGKRS